MSPETSRKLQAFVMLAMLSVAEGRRVSSAIPLGSSQSDGSAFHVDGGAGEGAYTGAEQAHLAKLQAELRTLTDDLMAIMADSFLQEKATTVAEQVGEVMMADPLSKEVVTQMQVMIADPYLQGEAAMLMKKMENAETIAKRAQAMESFMTNPRLHEQATLLVKLVEAMKANQKLQDQTTRIAQRIETLIEDASLEEKSQLEAIGAQVRRMAAHIEAIGAQVTSQKTADGPTLDSFSLAEVNRSRSGVSFLPPGLQTRDIQTTGARALAPEMVSTAGKGRSVKPQFDKRFDDLGVLPPIGRWDPLQIREQGPERYRRFVEMEIKHGRLAMAAFLGVITTYSGIRFPGYLSLLSFPQVKFEDVPGGAISSWAAIPEIGWFQIVAFISILEVSLFKQDPLKEPGDVVPEYVPWVRYDDKGTREFKLNAERQNGRAAMMGITGMIIHEALTGNPVFPIESRVPY